jgi:hypothetical protein
MMPRTILGPEFRSVIALLSVLHVGHIVVS